jgi:TIGR02453 family protein
MSKQIFDFLAALKQNNNREWFNANKDSYKAALSDFEGIVAKMIHNVGQFDEHIRHLEPKDCIFRIYKDTRFSKNKDPYKTNMGAYLSRGGRKLRFSGYYLHFEPGGSFLSGGLYMPESAVLNRVREDVDFYYEELLNIINLPSFKKFYPQIEGDKLKTVPKGYSKDNPAIDLLRHKDLYVSHAVSDEAAQKPTYIDYATEAFRELKPYNDFLNRAIEDM